MLAGALEESEQVNMDTVYICLDFYKQASILTREKDLEAEAKASSRLARVHGRVLKDELHASTYSRRVMELALAMVPRPVNHEPWYQEARQLLEQYQAEAVAKDEQERAEKRRPLLEELKPELEALKAAAVKGYHVLLEHLYEKHPPKRADHRMTEKPNADNAKNLLKQAILHYHPDKQWASQLEPKWCVLCEEIVKELNNKYYCFK
jgi:hypothetical protein